MAAISNKPVKQCLGCALNLGKRCGVFEHPILKWKGRHCEAYNSPEFIEKYEQMQHPQGAKARKRERAERAKIAHTEDHHDGVKPPAHH